jgi:hypothetical protein
MEKLIEAVRTLSEDIGPRPSASREEKEAARYVSARLQEAGFKVKTEPFRGLSTFSLTYGIIYMGFVISSLICLILPIISFILALVSLLAFLTEASSVPTLSRVLPKRPSQNVVGVSPAKVEVKRRVVISAHLDSSRAALLWHPKLVAGFRRSFLAMVGAMFIITLLCLLGIFMPLGWLIFVQLICAIYLLSSVFLMIHRELFMKHTPGANDNASGVAVLLASAEELMDMEKTELWAIATGCEESGLCGMLAFMEAHAFPRENTYFINVDNCSAGCASYITSEGMLLRYPSSQELLKLAREVAAEEGLEVKARSFHTLPTDALVPMVRGYKAMSIMAFDERGMLPNWHWPTDTVGNVDQATLENAFKLVVGVVRKLDEKATHS